MNIPFFKIYSDSKDIKAVSKVIKRNTYWSSGKEIEEFEEKIARYIGRKYALVFNSGTSALHTLMLSYDIVDKEVIVPSFTFIATANTVVLAGGIPVFADIEYDTYGLDYDSVKRNITKDTKAIMIMHYAGIPCRDTLRLKKLAKQKKLLFIEDAAESFGSSINNIKCGNIGDSAIFSFCQNKIITTGEGGALVTDSKEVYDKAKLLRSHGRTGLDKDYFNSLSDSDYVNIGFNNRMPSMNAALGISQLKKINHLVSLRRKIAKMYDKELSKIKDIKLHKKLKNSFNIYQFYPILLKSKLQRDCLQFHLSNLDIATKIYFNPVHLKSSYRWLGYIGIGLKDTEDISSRILCLPIYPTLTKDEIYYIINNIKKLFN